MLAWYIHHDPKRLAAAIDRYARNAGVVFQITDSSGTTISLYPANKNKTHTKRRLYLNENFEKNIKDLKKYAFLKIIEDDMKKTLADRRQRYAPQSRSVAAFIFNEPKKDRMFSSSSFENNFKNMAILGKASNVLEAAKQIITAMSPAGKKDLNESLQNAGIRNVGDLENLLTRWKGEALNGLKDRNRHMTRARKRNRSVSYSISD
jgi:geranylgeranyl pyrophosphate synthase